MLGLANPEHTMGVTKHPRNVWRQCGKQADHVVLSQ